MNTKILNETVVPFHKAASLLPGSPTTRQLRRWRDEGVKVVATGKRAYLDWCKLGTTPVTSKEAHARFLAELNSEGPVG